MSTSPYATGPVMGSISTRNALYSGVCALASPTGGVNELIGEAFLALPMMRQDLAWNLQTPTEQGIHLAACVPNS